ncbi:MAG: NAD(P)/FAD-dependent oxidoreductase [Deltaproteobacteria bacterium]|nr:NAD(P)/FAD-dependent oxidoreductase [Deltaproteobacteria bacterium]
MHLPGAYGPVVPDDTHVDIVIVGAGISGIDAGYHVQSRLPGKTYAILEGRDAIGGTWDLFRYPGIRSDSDMYTLGFPFRPWTGGNAIASGESILAYLRETVELYGIDRKIRFGHRVLAARWSSNDARWTVDVHKSATGEPIQLTCSFLFLCAGYYDYAQGYTPEFPGRERFRGRIVHPQQWTPDIDYAGKRVVVIGSGATAVTLVPELAKRAAHVTMLQRSPTYIVSLSARDRVADWLRTRFSPQRAYDLARWKNVLRGMAFYSLSRKFPARTKKLLLKGIRQLVKDPADVAEHFTPTYKPWDQRVCVVPDGDLFAELDAGRASVVTDHIETFTETGITLRSGKTLEADLIITATGLTLQPFGGMSVAVDGTPLEPATTMVYKGMMLSDVPNLAFSIGYTNASWTLKCDLTSQYVCRLIEYLDKHGFTSCRPRRDPSVKQAPLLDFTSGFVQRSIDRFPRQGTTVPWKLYQNYPLDLAMLRYANVEDATMQFAR